MQICSRDRRIKLIHYFSLNAKCKFDVQKKYIVNRTTQMSIVSHMPPSVYENKGNLHDIAIRNNIWRVNLPKMCQTNH